MTSKPHPGLQLADAWVTYRKDHGAGRPGAVMPADLIALADAYRSLEEQLQSAQEQLHAEQRDRNFWAANNSRERQRLQEQYQAALDALAAIQTHTRFSEMSDGDVWFQRVALLLASSPASSLTEAARGSGLTSGNTVYRKRPDGDDAFPASKPSAPPANPSMRFDRKGRLIETSNQERSNRADV